MAQCPVTKKSCLGDLAEELKLELFGDPQVEIDHLAPLDKATKGALTLLTSREYRRFLPITEASAVILPRDMLGKCRTNALVSSNPALAYKQAIDFLIPAAIFRSPVMHSDAVIDARASIDPDCQIGPGSVVEADVVIGPGCRIGPGCVLERNAWIGAGTQLVAQVFIGHDVRIGKRCFIQAGARIGGEGFGFAQEGPVWHRIRQLGSVQVGDDVEIGSNTCIDRGALEDTVIEDGVKLDNLIQVGHNVRIGANTIIAGNTGIAGSTKIGSCCQIGGMVGIVGHLKIADHVLITGRSMVAQSIREPGVYSGGLPSDSAGRWRRNSARFRHLEELATRLFALEKTVRNSS